MSKQQSETSESVKKKHCKKCTLFNLMFYNCCADNKSKLSFLNEGDMEISIFNFGLNIESQGIPFCCYKLHFVLYKRVLAGIP